MYIERSNELKQLQEIEINILKEVIKICEKYNLKYFAIGGTCLGAIRHKGFIPWDDDIDIGMPRKDYEKFIEMAEGELPKNLFLQNYKTEADYTLNFTKIRDCNTTFIEKPTQNLNINHGIFIDIFPLDGVKEVNKLYKIDRFFIRSLTRIIALKLIPEYKLPYKIANIVRFILKPINLYKLHILIDKILEKNDYDKCDYITNGLGEWGIRETVPKKYFSNGCKIKFEEILINVPYEYDKYLTNVYGDYMTPPVKEKQVTHHETIAINTRESYKKYTN